MKSILTIFMAIAMIGGFNDIAKVNELKRQAKEAYLNGDYKSAARHYEYLTDSLNIQDDNIALNLANSYYNLQDTAKAINTYSQLLESDNKAVKSVANQQMGVIKNRKKQFKEALNHFKQALKADPTNADARYNYELLKKVLEEQEKQNQQNQDEQNKDQQEQNKEDQQNKDQQQQDQQNQDKNQQEQEKNEQQQQDQQNEQDQQQENDKKEGEEEEKDGEPKDEQEQKANEEQQNQEQEDDKQEGEPQSVGEKLKEMKISEEKAKMILEAMKNNEIQYIQQNKRKPTKRKDTSKPDW